jgi:hypothetical protein
MASIHVKFVRSTYCVLVRLSRLNIVAFARAVLIPCSLVGLVILHTMWVHGVRVGAAVHEQHLNRVANLLTQRKSLQACVERNPMIIQTVPLSCS